MRSVPDTGPAELRERLRAAGLGLGFCQVGFAPAEPPAHAGFYREWLRRGWHGEMGYLVREDAVRRRLSLQESLPGCRSVIVVSLSYAPEAAGRAPEGAGDPLFPVVARYAADRDYHAVFEERLGRLAERIEELAPGTRTLPYVDYGPVLERDHAQRAGLGWIGKNTLLIHPELGSYLLLGELLTTLELPPDGPFEPDRCGTCTRCLEACPTGAIRGPRELDARLCISYLTIELRGSIPAELRPLLGNRIFGCDICQEVCPWNADPTAPDDASPGGRVRPGSPVAPSTMIEWAEELLGLDADSFRARYRRSVFYRPGRDGLLRNLCVGLGNSGHAAAVEVLRRARRDPSPLVREHAAWALERLRERAASA
ncbi:MAG: tRNA epoxyqueuosine(34) reductase QueG [Gemmatimonadota bacterium]